MKNDGIKHIHCAPYHPSSNGAIERFNLTFKQALKASAKDGRTLSHLLADFLLIYRSTAHATTNRTPSSLFLQREVRTRFSLLQPDVTRRVVDKQADQIAKHDQHAKPRSFQNGQRAMVRSFHLTDPKWILGTVVRPSGPVPYVVRVDPGLEWKCHIDHIRETIATNTDIQLSSAEPEPDIDIPYSGDSNTTQELLPNLEL